MRPIKFRAWIKKGLGVGIKPFMTYRIEKLHFNKGEKGIDAENCKWDIDDINLMQFTGLMDKNDKEIFEGDIVEVNYDGETSIHEVAWFGEKYYYPAFDLDPDLDCECNGLLHIMCADSITIEIIGNIYEQSYLLDKK